MVIALGNNPPMFKVASLFGYACVVVPPTLNHNEVTMFPTQQHPLLLAPRHHHPLKIATTNQNTANNKEANGLSDLARNICEIIKAYSAGVIMVSSKTNQGLQQSSRSRTRLAQTFLLYLTFVSLLALGLIVWATLWH